MILTASIFIFSIDLVILSVVGAITLNIFIAVNHKPGRYQAVIKTKKTNNIHKDATLKKELLGVIEKANNHLLVNLNCDYIGRDRQQTAKKKPKCRYSLWPIYSICISIRVIDKQC